MYIIRLDDASEHMNVDKWRRVEELLDKYNVKPIVGVIPNNRDASLTTKYPRSKDFWPLVSSWHKKGWHLAMHGYDHQYISQDSGINPVHNRSEFAGIDLAKQETKIKDGISIFERHNLSPMIFFAPSHTFDQNTLTALKNGSNIRIISDTIANDIYFQDGFYFIPQQSGAARRLPFKTVTFCYHPNEMGNSAFDSLEKFIKGNRNRFGELDLQSLKKRRQSPYDKLLKKIYFARRSR